MTRVLYNIIYHFGSIFDKSVFLSYLVAPQVLLDDSGLKNVGRVVGSIFYYTFYHINDYEYPDITIVYPQE